MATAGVIGVFGNEHDVLKAATAARKEKQYKKYDVFTPYPVHGMDDAMGIKRSFLPWVTLFGGITGLATAAGLEIWTSAIDWPLNVGGKPLISLPAFIPIFFELTVLLAGLSTVAALFAVCRLPTLKPRILHPRITNDKFVIFIPSTESGFSESDATQFLTKFKPEEVTTVRE